MSTEQAVLPQWAQWQRSAAYTVGIEEEVMLLDPSDWRLAQRVDDVLVALDPALARSVSAETHQGAIELATDPHDTVGGAVAQLGGLRRALAGALEPMGLTAAVAGTHPTAQWHETRVSPAARYQLIHQTMGELARREPTFALHVHVGVPDAESAIRLMNRLRVHLPLLLALSANSPYWQGRDARLASSRTLLFQAFPRTGIPRRFLDYADWAQTVDVLLRCGAFPEPTFLWWDVRPQPRFGTLEIRIMDAQTSLPRVGALVALVQALARLELEDGWAPETLMDAGEVLAENRFLAARDGMYAELIDPDGGCRTSVRAQLRDVLHAVGPHARALDCTRELRPLRFAGADTGAERQRSLTAGGAGLDGLMRSMAATFATGA